MSALSPRDQIAALLLLLALLALVAVITRRLAGAITQQSTNVLVRCREGHTFTTRWLPYATVTAMRLRARYDYCPVGRHWSLITQVQ